jgi:NADPH-dependent 2,4-dienoyl-CoA reductase/sulfur reductase-like enzyme/NAD-dependent dihydropyrimidine dehydrogenase PreA subunit
VRPILTFNRDRCLACLSCELACSLAHSASELLEAAAAEPLPARRRVTMAATPSRAATVRERFFDDPLPGGAIEALRCEQCAEPLCVFACKSGALQRDPITGGIVLDDKRCVGCFMCLMVCPSGVRPDAARDRVVRCDVCRGRDVPACVTACPTGALAAGAASEKPAPSEFHGRVVVIGSSAAGIAACEAAREYAPDCSITLVTADASPQYSRPLLAYVLAGVIDPSQIDWRAEGYLEKLGVAVLSGRKAASLRIDRGARSQRAASPLIGTRLPEPANTCPQECGHGTLRACATSVVLDDGSELAFDSLIVATGARGAKLAIPGADLAGVYGLRDLEDLQAILRLAGPGRRAVVLGGGNVGLQVCEAFLARGMQVTVVVASPHLLSQMLDAEAGRRVAELFGSRRLNIRTGRDAVEIDGAGRVERVRLDNGEWIGADVVVVAKGIAPNVEWLRGSGVQIGRGITVDLAGRTNVVGVFAAGDCAEAADPITGRPSVSGIWPVAYEMGRAAGCAAVGIERPSAGALRMNASRFFGVSIVSIGEVRTERLPGATQQVLENGEGVYRKLVFCEDRLAGALLYGDITDAGRFYRRYREAWRSEPRPSGSGEETGWQAEAPAPQDPQVLREQGGTDASVCQADSMSRLGSELRNV